MNNLVKILLAIIALIMLVRISVDAYDDQLTHPTLTRKAIRPNAVSSSSKLDSYLKQYFGLQFTSGIETLINGSQVIDIIAQGSTAEDHPPCQAANHFHNPLRLWDSSQMSDAQTHWKLHWRLP